MIAIHKDRIIFSETDENKILEEMQKARDILNEEIFRRSHNRSLDSKKTKFGRHPFEPNNSPFITSNHYKILVRKVKKMVDEMESKISNDFEPIPAEIDDIAYLLHKMSKMVIVKGISD